MDQVRNRIQEHLALLYGEQQANAVLPQLLDMISRYKKLFLSIHQDEKWLRLSEQDSILICYGDQVQHAAELHLDSLADFLENSIHGLITGLHLLPFYPYSSDDGFSVIDYRRVDPALGSWQQVERLGQSFRLMFDAVINHISVRSDWFQRFLNDDPVYKEYFIVIEGDADLSQVVRPRALPLLTNFQSSAHQSMVWTTFSADQVDLNFHNPRVLLEIIDLLLFYVTKGAELIRLDAIAYLWKQVGTSCIHLPETHHIIQLFRAVLDVVAPGTILVTETNVPHQDNISYFGDGYNEAQMVYNFALPPLVLHTLQTGNASILSRWVAGLATPGGKTTFFNFLASHDGIGLNPARGILDDQQITTLVERALAHGGRVSYKSNPDGGESPYELNINYFDALSDPGEEESLEVQINRFVAAHAIMFSLQGVPGIYFHSLFGSRGWQEGIAMSGQNRTINRQKFSYHQLQQELAVPQSLRSRVFKRLSHLLQLRANYPIFHPAAKQHVVELGEAIFALQRISQDGHCQLVYLQNVSAKNQRVGLDPASFGAHHVVDLINQQPMSGNHKTIELTPYQTCWYHMSA